MSRWGQDADRVGKVRADRTTDIERWGRIDSHNPEWRGRTREAAKHIPPGSRVLEIGAGLAQLRALLDAGTVYQPSDIVRHQDDFLVIDLNRGDPIPGGFDVVVALGVLEYVHDVQGALAKLAGAAPRSIVTYCCRLPGAEVEGRLRQGWLTDYAQGEFGDLVRGAGLQVEHESSLQVTDAFEQILVVARSG